MNSTTISNHGSIRMAKIKEDLDRNSLAVFQNIKDVCSQVSANSDQNLRQAPWIICHWLCKIIILNFWKNISIYFRRERSLWTTSSFLLSIFCNIPEFVIPSSKMRFGSGHTRYHVRLYFAKVKFLAFRRTATISY